VTRSAPASHPAVGGGIDNDDDVTNYARSSFDLLRLIVFGVLAVLVALATRYLGEGADGFEEELSRLLDAPVDWMRATFDVLLIATVACCAIAVLVIPLITRQMRLLGYVAAAMVLSSVVFALAGGWIGLRIVTVDPNASTEAIARTFAANVAATAQLVATFVTTGPFVTLRWRRLGLAIVAAVLLLQLAVVPGEPTHVLLVLTTGYAVASAVLFAFGRPTSRPALGSLMRILRRSGVPVTSLQPTGVSRRGTLTYSGTALAAPPTGSDAHAIGGTDGAGGGENREDALFVQVLGSDRLSADLLRRAYRVVRYRSPGDDRPFTSIRRSVEHEALVSFQARDVGVRTPRLRSLAAVGEDSFLVAFDRIDGHPLHDVLADAATTEGDIVQKGDLDSADHDSADHDSADLDSADHDSAGVDAILRSVWEQVAILQAGRIAHRDLRTQNVIIDQDGQAWVVGLWQAEIAAGDAQLRADLAQVLTALAMAVGSRRAVLGAVEVLGADAVADCIGLLQPLALTRDTRSEMSQHPGLLDEIRDEIERRCKVEHVELEPITRLGPRQLLTMVMLVAVVYFLVPQFADLPGIVEQVAHANWLWVVPAVVASSGTYLAASLSLTGATPGRLPIGTTAIAQLGSSFTSTIAPAGIGGMALNVRFLQRQGVDAAVATSSVGLDTVGGFVGHIILLGIFLVWAGRDTVGDVRLPSPVALLIGTGVVVAIALLMLALPSTRRLVRTKLVPTIGKAARGLRDVLTTPSKIAQMLCGSILVTLFYLLAFVASTAAFDLDASFATIGAVYLFGSAIAIVAPTPGGVGATEAALIGGMVAVGIGNEQAVPAVFLFRLVTFWFPILPGWIAFSWLRRTDRL